METLIIILERAVIYMKEVRTSEDLMEQLSNMNKENSVCQVFIPGKGKFTIELQEEDFREKEGRAMLVSELIRNPFIFRKP
jgi:hypothetical protein